MKEEIAQIVSAYVRRNPVPNDQLPNIIATVYAALSGLGKEPALPAPLKPAVPIRGSAGANAVTCLECGFKAKMIRRHLKTAHKLTADEYKARWGLRPDYPMVAKNYSATRSALAKSLGLGRTPRLRGGRRAAAK